MSANSTDPSQLFGGTWQRIQDVFLLAGGSTYAPGSIGGEAAHAIDESEVPPHAHDFKFTTAPLSGQHSNVYFGCAYSGVGSGPGNDKFYTATGSVIGSSSGGQAHNNMPPYLSVYVWKRTA